MGHRGLSGYAHLRGPLGLVLAPNGDLITSNGDAVNADPTQPSELVEFTPQGKFVGQFSIDPSEGAAFGLAVSNVGGVLRLAAVEDVTNSLDVWTFNTNSRSSFASYSSSASGFAASDANFVTTIGMSSGILRRVGCPRPSTNCSVSPRSRTFLRPCSPTGTSCGVSCNPFQAFGLGGQKFVSLLFS